MKLSKKYLFFVLSIIISLFILLVITQWQIQSQEKNAEIYNLATRQRILSQMMAKSILENKTIISSNEYIKEWKSTQLTLLHFTEIEGLQDIHKRLTHEYEIIKNISLNSSAVKMEAFDIFFQHMESTVKALENHNIINLTNFSHYQFGIITLLILLIITQYRFLILPSSNKLEEQLKNLSYFNKLNTILIKNSPIAIALVNENLDYFSKSGNWDTLFESKHNKSLRETPPFVEEKWKLILKKALQGEIFKDKVEVGLDTKKCIKWHISHWQDDNKIRGLILYAQDITEQNNLEFTVQQTIKQLSAILNSAYVSIVTTDKEGLISSFSKGAEKMLGYKAEEMVGINSAAVLHDSEEVKQRAKELSTKFNTSVKGFQTFIEIPNREGFEIRDWTYLRKKGVRIPVQLVVSALKDDSGHSIGYLGIASDISALKSLEGRYIESNRLLKESQLKSERTIDLLEEMQGFAKIGYWELNLETNKLFWSKETKRIHEVDDDYIPKFEESIDFYDTKSKPIFEKAIEQATQFGDSWNEKLIIVTAKGNKKWIKAVGKVYFQDGKPQLIHGLCADISEDVKMRNQNSKSQQRFKLLAENTNDMVGLHNVDGTYAWVSPASKTLLGYESDSLIGQNPYQFFHPDDIDRIKKEAHDPVVISNQSIIIEYRMLHKEGHYIWVETLSKGILSKNQPISIITSTREITERVQIQQELIENYKALSVAKEAAEKAANSKKQFLATMSHEIRTPLNAINGLSHILLLESPREDQIENLRLLNFSGENLLNLINDILDISKIESGKLTLAERSFDLKYLLVNIQKSMLNRANENMVNLNLNYDEELPQVFIGDSSRLSQVLYNLVGNAIKFTRHGSVTIAANLLKQKNNNYSLRISVKDTGIGITESNQTNIFNSFEQADSGISRKYGGTGLGLYISQKLIELMNSDIKLESVEGIGSNFYFDIELKEGDLGLFENQEVTSKIKDFSDKHINVLIAEDNLANQMIILKFLKLYNVKYEIANNGQEAVEKIKSKLFNLVLMDIQMPIMDGFSASNEIRKLEGEYFKKIPIVALTADAFQDVKDKSLSKGMDDYLSKPFRPEELIKVIGDYYPVVADLKVTSPSSERTSEESISSEPGIPQNVIEIILDKQSDGDLDFKLEFAKRCKRNFVEFKVDFEQSIVDGDLDQLEQSYHKLKTILKIFELGDFSNKMKSLLNKEKQWDDSIYTNKIEIHLNKIIADFLQIISKYE